MASCWISEIDIFHYGLIEINSPFRERTTNAYIRSTLLENMDNIKYCMIRMKYLCSLIGPSNLVGQLEKIAAIQIDHVVSNLNTNSFFHILGFESIEILPEP